MQEKEKEEWVKVKQENVLSEDSSSRHQEDMHTAVMSVQVMLAKSVLEQNA